MKSIHRLTVAAVVFVLLICAAQAWAGIDEGPWLTGVTQTAITVKWLSAQTDGVIDYGTTDALGEETTAEFSSGVHQVDLDSLVPGTRYYYQVTSGGDTSALQSFETAPEDIAPFHFAILTDTQSDQTVHRAVVENMILDQPQFILNNGDLVEFPFVESLWTDFWDITSLIAGTASYFPVRGNHDGMAGGEDHFIAYFANPMNQDAVSQYAFQYGNTYFINMDINEAYNAGSDQYRWVEDQLQQAKADPTVKHCIVRAHYPLYSCGPHGTDADVIAFRDAMGPLFEKYDIDLYFSGHDHVYQRSVVNGITYIVVGSAGGTMYTCDPQDWTVKYERSHSYIHVEVDGTQIYVEARRPDGTVIESFTVDHDFHGGAADDDTIDDDTIDDDADDDGADDDIDDDDSADDDATDDDAGDDDDDSGCGC